jgi:two-component system, chemotaxis family, response regulator Rcp1
MADLTTTDVLLVEDSPAYIYLIQRAVQDCGSDIRLSVVPDGGEALAFLRKDAPFAHVPSPALILLDLQLPTMHGHQVLTELRRLPAYQATPVVILSGARPRRKRRRAAGTSGLRRIGKSQ